MCGCAGLLVRCDVVLQLMCVAFCCVVVLCCCSVVFVVCGVDVLSVCWYVVVLM